MSRLDSRAWLIWGAAATLPLLTGRHPLVLAELIAIALVVRAVCLAPSRSTSWGWLARLSALAVPIGVVFNLITVHAGEQAIATLPEGIPLFGGVLTWNAAVYGALSGLTVVALVLIGTTVAAGIEWNDLMRLLPARAAGLAVAGSVAWAFLPRLAVSWREIREAQTARGHRWSGPRDAVPLVVPLLAGGLDRSILMAEALEARGFGAIAAPPATRLGSVAIALAAVLATTGLYLFAVGRALGAAALLGGAALLVALAVTSGRGSSRPRVTRYRSRRWTLADTVVVAGAALAVVATAVALQVGPEALRYDPYPTLRWPAGSIGLLLALAALLLPAVVAPAAVAEEPER
jgi:energy-coupling factor transport system permease protein